ncbi:MAG: beta-lactamase family protein [Ferruginibacter sp.]|nr:beta-lactamase family protein [Ferruginibacter sp.]
MSFIRKTILYLCLLLVFILLFYFIYNQHKKADGQLKNDLNETENILKLPQPGFVSAYDSTKIHNACLKWFDTVLKPAGFNGGILVAKNNKIIFEAYTGTGHIPGNDTITYKTPMHIASVSKTFTAMAVLKLVQDGKLQLDDEFSKYFPTFNFPGVTIRCLLSHRSGLPNYNYYMETFGWDKSRFVSNKDVFDYLVNHKAEMADITAPNTHFSYCNTNFALLALLVEKITGESYAEFLRNTFFIPLQMKDTYVFTLADTLTATPSYNWRGKIEPFNFLDQVYGDKNIYTTPQDLLIWDRALKSKLIFTDTTLLEAYSPYSNEKPGIRNYGLGWRMYIFPDGNKIVYHNGWWHGSNAAFIRLLKENATIIVIGNKFTRTVYHARALTSLFGNYYKLEDEEQLEEPKISNINPDSVIIKPKLNFKKPTTKKGINVNKSN